MPMIDADPHGIGSALLLMGLVLPVIVGGIITISALVCTSFFDRDE